MFRKQNLVHIICIFTLCLSMIVPALLSAQEGEDSFAVPSYPYLEGLYEGIPEGLDAKELAFIEEHRIPVAIEEKTLHAPKFGINSMELVFLNFDQEKVDSFLGQLTDQGREVQQRWGYYLIMMYKNCAESEMVGIELEKAQQELKAGFETARDDANRKAQAALKAISAIADKLLEDNFADVSPERAEQEKLSAASDKATQHLEALVKLHKDLGIISGNIKELNRVRREGLMLLAAQYQELTGIDIRGWYLLTDIIHGKEDKKEIAPWLCRGPSISAEPGEAEIFINDSPRGSSPVEAPVLIKGPLKIAAAADFHAKKEQYIFAGSSFSKPLHFILEPTAVVRRGPFFPSGMRALISSRGGEESYSLDTKGSSQTVIAGMYRVRILSGSEELFSSQVTLAAGGSYSILSLSEQVRGTLIFDPRNRKGDLTIRNPAGTVDASLEIEEIREIPLFPGAYKVTFLPEGKKTPEEWEITCAAGDTVIAGKRPIFSFLRSSGGAPRTTDKSTGGDGKKCMFSAMYSNNPLYDSNHEAGDLLLELQLNPGFEALSGLRLHLREKIILWFIEEPESPIDGRWIDITADQLRSSIGIDWEFPLGEHISAAFGAGLAFDFLLFTYWDVNDEYMENSQLSFGAEMNLGITWKYLRAEAGYGFFPEALTPSIMETYGQWYNNSGPWFSIGAAFRFGG